MSVVVEQAECGRAFAVRLGVESVGVLRFGIPVESTTDWTVHGEFSYVGYTEGLGVTLRVFEDVDVVSLILTVEADPGTDVAVPQIDCELELAAGHSGWGSVTGASGFLVVSPAEGEGPVVTVGLRRGRLEDLRGERVFLADPEPESLFDVEVAPQRPGFARFAVEPVDVLTGGRRAQTVLRIASYPTFDAAVSDLTQSPMADAAWGPGGPVVIDAPDQALVVPAGVVIEPDEEPEGPIEASVVNGPPGHHFAQLRGASGSHMMRLSFNPKVSELMGDACLNAVSTDVRQASSALGFLVSQSLQLGIAPDVEAALDWCESTDWLDRDDLFGVATTANLARLGRDSALFCAAWGALGEQPMTFGYGLVALHTYLAGISVLGKEPIGFTQLVASRAPDDLARLEMGMIGTRSEETFRPILHGAINRLGGGHTHGQPLGVTASEAGRLVGVLRLTPENWTLRSRAVDAAAHAETLLLCDAIAAPEEYEGLAWLKIGDLVS